MCYFYILWFYCATVRKLSYFKRRLPSRSITIIQDECNANCYEIEVVTAKDPNSGTDDKIEIQLEGQNGTFSEWFKLNSPTWFYNDFETDLKTTYYAQDSFQVTI